VRRVYPGEVEDDDWGIREGDMTCNGWTDKIGRDGY
jgi:hypothetical protein